jgi:hypothetical protein
VDAAARRKILGLVGLGVRGRLAVVGVQQVREAANKGKLRVALVAMDASKNSLDKVLPLLTARRVRVIDALGAAEREGGAGAVALDGQMLDEAVRVAALRVLARAGQSA